MGYITKEKLTASIRTMQGTADHMLKIWFVLKQMGMKERTGVSVTTSNPKAALVRLFGFHHHHGDYFIPFCHTERFFTMKADAGRSIIQTTLKQWLDNTSVGNDPTGYLHIEKANDGAIHVRPKRDYPIGLGFGRNGFARDENTQVKIPDVAFMAWFYREEEIEDNVLQLRKRLKHDLNLSDGEYVAIFVESPMSLGPLASQVLSPGVIAEVVENFLKNPEKPPEITDFAANYHDYESRVTSMTTISNGPIWLRDDPTTLLKWVVTKLKAKAVLLYGPPRTGKTRAVDTIFPRADKERATIQIHDGWGYDELVTALRPLGDSKWGYVPGELLKALQAGRKVIVLEEINRTQFTAAIGEVFSLLEESYRGKNNAIRLRNGDDFSIEADVLFLATMNSLDRSTERLDDAMFGRFTAIEFPPRVEALQPMLAEAGVEELVAKSVREVFAFILKFYPLGHGYFAGFGKETPFIAFYLTRIRPVLQAHLQGHRDTELGQIDNLVDRLFKQ